MASKSAIKKHAKQLPIAQLGPADGGLELDNRAETSSLDLKTMVDPDAVRAVIGGEMEPPALEDNPSETLETGEIEPREAERVQVPVDGPAATGGHAVDPVAAAPRPRRRNASMISPAGGPRKAQVRPKAAGQRSPTPSWPTASRRPPTASWWT